MGLIHLFDPDSVADNSAMILSLVMSIALVFLIMGALFESFILPISILTTIPMAIFGAYWSLYLTGTSFDNIAAIGLIVLVGVVVNNGIVLIELVTRLRNEGMDRLTAMIESWWQTSATYSDDRHDHDRWLASNGIRCWSQHIWYILYANGTCCGWWTLCWNVTHLILCPIALSTDR